MKPLPPITTMRQPAVELTRADSPIPRDYRTTGPSVEPIGHPVSRRLQAASGVSRASVGQQAIGPNTGGAADCIVGLMSELAAPEGT